jgi:ataxin-10
LLKLLDSYLQSTGNPQSIDLYKSIVPILTTEFLTLSTYTRTAINKSLGSSASAGDNTADDVTSSESLRELDLLLPKVCEALVLVTQCLITMLLHLELDGADEAAANLLKVHLNDSRATDGHGVPESLLGKHRQSLSMR